jgi:hypothetical protein
VRVHRATRAAIIAVALAGCAAPIDLSRVRAIEIDGRLVAAEPGASAGVSDERVVLTGERLRTTIAASRCRRGAVLWKGGIPATLVLDDGERIDIDGFSFYGHFYRIHRGQWCEVPNDVWGALWADHP